MEHTTGSTSNTSITLTRYRHAYLLASLLLVIVARPFFVERVLGVGIIDVLLFITLIAGALTTTMDRRQVVVVGLLAAISAIARIAWLLHGTNATLYMFLGFTSTFYATIAFVLVKTLFRTTGRITMDTIYCAVSVYLLLGLLWTLAYTILELTAPGSFTFGGSQTEFDPQFERFLGFSFTTLTTLGYGNIAPATPQADAMSTLEAIIGQIYLAIVIARLVAIQVGQHEST